MKINSISLPYFGIKTNRQKSVAASNSIVKNSINYEIQRFPLSFGSLIPNSELLKMGYKIAKVENNKVANDDDSIIISSPDKLLALQNSPNIWNKKIVLACDIDLGGKKIKPIGNATKPFKGEFDGNGCKISNFKIDSSEGRNVGLFGKCENAQISNLEIENAFIRGNQQVGGFVGYANNSKLQNCFFQGYIEGHKNIGGLIGTGNKNTIKDSGTKCNILAKQKIEYNPFDFDNDVSLAESLGGLIGSDNNSTIESSYSDSNLEGVEQVGGLIGYSANTIIQNTIFKGIVTGKAKSGSFLGWAENSNIQDSYSLSNKKDFIGLNINSSASNIYNSLDELIADNRYWNGSVWNKSNGRIPRLKIQEKRMTPKELFLEDFNIDIKTGKIKNLDNLGNKPIERININLKPPKHYDENNELLEEIKNSQDKFFLRDTFGKLAISLRDSNLLGKNSTDKYDELFVSLVQNPNMDINSTYEHETDDLSRNLYYNVWCTPLFILTCMNKAYALKEALKRDDVDFTVGSGYNHDETILNQAFIHHIDDCAYVLLTEPKIRSYIDEKLNYLKSQNLSALGKLLLDCYPDNIPPFDEKNGYIEFSQEVECPKELLEKVQEVKTLIDAQRTFSADANYTDSVGNNIVNIAATLDDQEEALRILIAAKEIGTNISNWNKKAESPIGHGIYTNKPHFVAQILNETNDPFTRLSDGTDAMLLFSKMPEENYSINYMDIARSRGLSINTCDEVGNTPLINAIDLGHHKAVKYLLANGANPNKCDNNQQTPLHHACVNGDTDAIIMLLNAYAYPNVRDISGNLPFDYLNNDIKETINEELESQLTLYQSSDIFQDFSPTYTNSNLDRYDEISSLNNISQKVINGENVDLEILQLTKNFFLNSNVNKLKDSNNNSILHIVSQSTSPYAKECLKVALEKGADINSLNDDKETPLMSAVNAYLCTSSPEEKINLMQNIKLLLDNEPNVDLIDNNKQSVLHKLCQSGNLILFNEILKLNPKINQVDINGNTPFQYIPENANVPMYIAAREYLKNNKIIKA